MCFTGNDYAALQNNTEPSIFLNTTLVNMRTRKSKCLRMNATDVSTTESRWPNKLQYTPPFRSGTSSHVSQKSLALINVFFKLCRHIYDFAKKTFGTISWHGHEEMKVMDDWNYNASCALTSLPVSLYICCTDCTCFNDSLFIAIKLNATKSFRARASIELVVAHFHRIYCYKGI